MHVYTENQVMKLLKQQRENCAQILEIAKGMGEKNVKELAESVRNATAPALTAPLETYFAQDMKRSFLAGFGAGFDACTIHWKDQDKLNDLQHFDYQHEFGEWLLKYNRRKEGSTFIPQKEKKVSK